MVLLPRTETILQKIGLAARYQGEQIMTTKSGTNVFIQKLLSYIPMALLILSLLPLMYVGRYNHPTGDDYYYGANTHLVWEETGSIVQTVKAACHGVAEQYEIWQGTYSAMFFMHLAPNVFSDVAYAFVTTFILLLLTIGIFYFLKPLLCQYMGCSRDTWCAISSMIALLCIHTVPSQGETFFWYNGSMYYTGFFAVTLIFGGLICRFLWDGKMWRMIPIWSLAIFLAGGNYVSLLPCLILLFCLAIALSYRKKRKECLCIIITFTLMLLGLFVSALAPGNRIRQSGMWKIPAYMAILKSLYQGLKYAKAWIGIWWMITALIVTPLFWKSYRVKNYRFPYPVLVIGFVYGVFCSMSCPLFYTMNSTGPARAVSIVYYGFILSTFFCYYYLGGAVHRFLSEKKQELYEQLMKPDKRRTIAVIALVCLFFLLQIQSHTFADCSGHKAISLLASGEARRYHEEYLDRLDIWKDPAVTDVILHPFQHQPDMLYVGDLPADPLSPTNQMVAKYFGKNTNYVDYYQSHEGDTQ